MIVFSFSCLCSIHAFDQIDHQSPLVIPLVRVGGVRAIVHMLHILFPCSYEVCVQLFLRVCYDAGGAPKEAAESWAQRRSGSSARSIGARPVRGRAGAPRRAAPGGRARAGELGHESAALSQHHGGYASEAAALGGVSSPPLASDNRFNEGIWSRHEVSAESQ